MKPTNPRQCAFLASIQPGIFRLLHTLLAITLLCTATMQALPVSAAEVSSLYEALLPVTSRDNERERTQAFRAGLQNVLLKLSGRNDTLDNPTIRRELGNAQALVESWAYRTSTEQGGAAPTEKLSLEITYFRTAIQNLLDSAGIPVWPQNRPDTLVWMVVQDVAGERSIASSTSAELQALQQFASNRGLPLISPILDLEDQLALRPDALWNFDIEGIKRASERYQTPSILVLRVYRLLSGEVIARAVYLFRDLPLELEVLESPLPRFLDDSIAMAAQELAANYSILLSGVDENSSVALVVEGVLGISDYAGLLNYLKSIAVVKEVQVIQVDASTVELKLATGGQLRQLLESIALDKKMVPLTEPTREFDRVRIRYQWQKS